eukprot:TRINITY_DN24415_c0_g1_i1.p1 TRINITY_DN24415_c0_g1~~TRINITY_DN24415_c0_g1_i1.p1  ORF type:complete len:874 (+),score=148.32 TRINITY_DN24415_c0_g1_i1:49-2622(+)
MNPKSYKNAVPEGYYNRICRVIGRIGTCKGLPNGERRGRLDPYVIIKGIRSNNHTVNVYSTSVHHNTFAPDFNEDFDFHVPASWGLRELVGLRLMAYDSEDLLANFDGSETFLAGVDVDLSACTSGRTVSHEVEMGGVETYKIRGSRRPRVSIVITVYREVLVKPQDPRVLMLQSVRKVNYVREVVGRIIQGEGLKNRDLVGLSDPQCIVRIVFLSGEVREIARSEVIPGTLDPVWNMQFQFTFEPEDQPLLITVDVYDSDNPTDPTDRVELTGEHLGSAAYPLLKCLPPHERKQVMRLVGRSQKHESRLDKDGIPHDADTELKTANSYVRTLASIRIAQESMLEDRKPTSVVDHMVSLGKKMKAAMTDFLNGPVIQDRSLLTVEFRTRIKSEDMPHLAAMDKAVQVADVYDVERILALPDWQRGIYAPPKALIEPRNDGEPSRGTLGANEEIVFVYGQVMGASGIFPTKSGTKNDSYVVIEGVSRKAEHTFIHRTRMVPKKNTPEWYETFYLRVPEDAEVSRLVFSVYHSRQDPAREDAFLGRASLDLAYQISGESIAEDLPLVGATSVVKPKVTTGFRRPSSLSVEVFVERRVKPQFVAVEEDSLTTLPPRSHFLSRKEVIPGRWFEDLSQEPCPVPSAEQEAPKVLELHSTGQLVQGNRKLLDMIRNHHRDMKPSDFGTSDTLLLERDLKRRQVEQEIKNQQDELLAAKRAKERRRDLADINEDLPEGADFNKRIVMKKAKSLSALQTRFGKPPNIFAASSKRDLGDIKHVTLKQGFSAKSSAFLAETFSDILHKPDVADLVQHGRPSSAQEHLLAPRTQQQLLPARRGPDDRPNSAQDSPGMRSSRQQLPLKR